MLPAVALARPSLGAPLLASIALHGLAVGVLVWAFAAQEAGRRPVGTTSFRSQPALQALLAPAGPTARDPAVMAPPERPSQLEAQANTATAERSLLTRATAPSASPTGASLPVPAATTQDPVGSDSPAPMATSPPMPALPAGIPGLPSGGRRLFAPAWVQGPPPDEAWRAAQAAARQRDMARAQFEEGMAQLQVAAAGIDHPPSPPLDCRFEAAWTCRSGQADSLQGLNESARRLRNLRPELAPTIRMEGGRVLVSAEPLGGYGDKTR